jgi:hypothetical protein
MSHLICGIHDERPDVCKNYPRHDSYMPEPCGYRFTGGKRKGGCYAECQGACCMLPRQDGEPGGAPMPEVAGGIPCKHLIDVEESPEGLPTDMPEGAE